MKFFRCIIVASAITNIANANFMDSMVNMAGSIISNSTQLSDSNNSLPDILAKSLGINNSTKTLAGTVILMNLASSAMPKDRYKKLLKSVPALYTLMGSNSKVCSILSNIATQKGNIASSFKSFGVNRETLSKLAPTLLGYISKYTTADNVALLKKAWSNYLK